MPSASGQCATFPHGVSLADGSPLGGTEHRSGFPDGPPRPYRRGGALPIEDCIVGGIRLRSRHGRPAEDTVTDDRGAVVRRARHTGDGSPLAARSR